MARRPKPELAEWLIAQRRGHGESTRDVARVVDRSEATIRGWEAGRPPRSDDASIVVLERHWGSVAPKEAPPGDQTGLVTAIEKQTQAINELVELLRPMAEAQALQVADLQRAVQRLFVLVNPAEPGLPARRETVE